MNPAPGKHLWHLLFSFSSSGHLCKLYLMDLCCCHQSTSSASTAPILRSTISNSHRRQGASLSCQGDVFNQMMTWLTNIKRYFDDHTARDWSNENNGSLFINKGQTEALPEWKAHANPMQVIWHDNIHLHKSNKCPSVNVICCKLCHRQGPERVLFKENRFSAHIIIFLILSQCQPSAITPCQLGIVVLFSLACVNVRVRGSVDRWLRVWRSGGFEEKWKRIMWRGAKI